MRGCHSERTRPPRQHRSGSSVEKQPRISEAGNKHLRRALSMPALVAVMRKLLHATFGMFRHRTAFDGAKTGAQAETAPPSPAAQGVAGLNF